jgi:hypothetical protein
MSMSSTPARISGSAPLALLVVVLGCATPNDVRYTATYAKAGPTLVARLAVEGTGLAGYRIAKGEQRLHDYAFITFPARLDPADDVDVAFLVQVVYDAQLHQKKRFTIVVVPRPFVNDVEVSAERLPASARPRARALSDTIRQHAKSFEAPP